MAQDAYYSRTEVSNSDLTALKNRLYPEQAFTGDPTNAFKMGTLVDALVTEPDEANHVRKTVGDYQYSDEEWKWGIRMRSAFNNAAENIPFLGYVRANADTQRVMVKNQEFEFNGFLFKLDTRCKWDFWMKDAGFGGDLKTTAATTKEQFEEAIDMFDWDRSRAWYMDIAGSDQDFIVAISKKNQRIFTKAIRRGDEIYERGKAKYLELAFKYWTLKI